MGEVLFFGCAALAVIGALAGQALLAAAREHVRAAHPAWFAQLGEGGFSLRMGGTDARARRRLLRPLLLGTLPPGPAEDAELRKVAGLVRVAILAAALGFAGMVLAVALRGGAA